MLENIALKLFADTTVSLVTKEAEKVLGSNQGVEGLEEVKVCSFWGRRYQHWSQYVAGAGAIAGLIVAVVGYVASTNVFTVIGAFFFLTNTISLYNLTRFVPMRTLEGYVDALTKRVNKLGEHIFAFREANRDFDTFNKDFAKQLKESKAMLADTERELGNKVHELQALAKKLAMTDEKLLAYQTLCENLKKAAGEVTAQVTLFNDANGKIHDGIDILAVKVEEARAIERAFREGLVTIEGQDEAFAKANGELAKMMADLRHQVTVQQKLYEQLRSERVRLEKQVDSMSRIQDKATREAEDLRHAGADIADAAKALNNVVDQVEGAEEAVQKVAKNMEEAKERAKRIEAMTAKLEERARRKKAEKEAKENNTTKKAA